MKKGLLTLCWAVILVLPALAQQAVLPNEYVARPDAPHILIAGDFTWPPMEYLDASKKPVGFGIDLLEAMADTGEFTYELKNVAWDGIFAGLMAGRYDMIASSVAITEEREAVMDFSAPYFLVMQGVVVRKGSGINAVGDLYGKSVGAQIGTTGYFAAQGIPGAKARSYDDVGLAFQDLAGGKLDAVICDDAVAYDFALLNDRFAGRFSMPFLLEGGRPEYLGFVFQKGDPKGIIPAVNRALKQIMDSGMYVEIYTNWFGSKPPRLP